MEITSSSVSVYEIVLDLKQWHELRTNQIPGFTDALIRFLPTTAQHKCVAGRVGGFHEELVRGTNLAHVVEHVLLEFIHLTDPAHREYSGWTKELGNGVFRINYGAPGFLEGRLAPILATDAVRHLQAGLTPDLESFLADMRDPLAYFARSGRQENAAVGELVRNGVLPPEEAIVTVGRPAAWNTQQRQRLALMFGLVDDHLPQVTAAWREAFFAFGGEFARGIVDKVEILNPDRFRDALRVGKVDTCFDGIASLSGLIRTLRIPLVFLTHAAWLYKNQLQLAVVEALIDDHTALTEAIGDLDDFYGNLLLATVSGYGQHDSGHGFADDPVLRGFRARHVRPSSVLIVDDDVMSRRAVRDILGYHGISTISAGNGLDALRALESHRFEIAVAILDLVLPGMDGLTVCRRIRDSYPQVRIVLSSGYPLDAATGRCLAEHEVCFLGKPFESKSLLATVRGLMDRENFGAHTTDG